MKRTLKRMLRCFLHPFHDDWARYLPTPEFAYNSQVNVSIGLSPFLANYGFEPLTPLSVNLPQPLGEKTADRLN
uniref:Reverse transcriptase domain protein n=1 Tax=Tetraselmis sp. GSL018 TaxID=582737 RepID=A0A061QPW4_9CHLO